MRVFIISTMVLGLSASAGAAPKAVQPSRPQDILMAGARAVVAPLITRSDMQVSSSKGAALNAALVDSYISSAASAKSCGKKNPAPPPKCPPHRSPN